jgi:hypothetical protein
MEEARSSAARALEQRRVGGGAEMRGRVPRSYQLGAFELDLLTGHDSSFPAATTSPSR